jgi:hypothetical protein
MTNRTKYHSLIFVSLLFANALRAGESTTTFSVPVHVCVAAPVDPWTIDAALVEANRVLLRLHINFDWQLTHKQSECESDSGALLPTIQIRKADTIVQQHWLIAFVSKKSGRIAVINQDELTRVATMPHGTGSEQALPHLALGRAIARSVIGVLDQDQGDLPKAGMLRHEWTRHDLSVDGSASFPLSPEAIEKLQTAAAEQARHAGSLRAER